jgi:N-acetylglucosaminyldiphosphoundecaprenol N-acetyl-beta-D-mannosaminyltransferase
MNTLVKKNILGVAVTDATKYDILQYILISLEKKNNPYYIVTPNPEIIVSASSNSRFQTILNQADIALADGVGVMIAGGVMGNRLKERFSGTDCMEELCLRVSKKPITVGFLGGRGGVAEKTAECLASKYPGLKVNFIGEEWSEEGFRNAQRISNFKFQISNSVDILFVAFGFPKQEEWMAEHIGKIPVRVMMGVGGAFDYLSGTISRAPKNIRNIGLEWMYRLVRQPWRIKRQISLLIFALMVLRNLLTRNKE